MNTPTGSTALAVRINTLESDITELRERCAFYERTNAEQAAILNRVIAERDFNAAYFEAYHQLRVAVNAAYPQDLYQLAEDVPALMQAEIAALRLKCDEAITACASETCAMAKDRDRLYQVCRNAYEVWAGSEGIPNPETCAEDYLLKLVEQMRDEVKSGLAKRTEDDIEGARRMV